MSSSTTGSDAADTNAGQTAPLVSTTKEGTPYSRQRGVTEELRRVLERPEQEWAAMAELTAPGRLTGGSIVHLIRKLGRSNPNLVGQLALQLSHRVIQVAKRWARGFSPYATEEIIEAVNADVIELVIAPARLTQIEFLEANFELTVKRRTLNQVEKYNSRLHSGATADASEEDDTSQQLRDTAPTPEEIIMQLQDEAFRPKLIKRARNAVRDPRHLEAVTLRYVDDWPITSQDPNAPTLERYFQMSGRQIQNWINQALKDMRTAIGDQL